MPFKSKSQLRVCYNTRKWDCNKWLKETPSVCCLPNKLGQSHSRCMRVNERIVGKVQTGPRGGRFFVIKEKNSSGEICQVKVYINR
jgi:hypothetical protein